MPKQKLVAARIKQKKLLRCDDCLKLVTGPGMIPGLFYACIFGGLFLFIQAAATKTDTPGVGK